MKQKKIAIFTAMSITAVTLASCGKAEQEVAARVDTEVALQETEELEPETEITATKNGQISFPDYAEDYVKFESIDPTDKYVIDDSQMFYDPNITEGILRMGGMEFYGNKITVDAKCTIDGVDYFRTVANDQNLSFIIPASVLADELPSEEKPDEAENDDDTVSAGEFPEGYEIEVITDETPEGLPEGQPNNDWSDVDPALLDRAERMILE